MKARRVFSKREVVVIVFELVRSAGCSAPIPSLGEFCSSFWSNESTISPLPLPDVYIRTMLRLCVRVVWGSVFTRVPEYFGTL